MLSTKPTHSHVLHSYTECNIRKCSQIKFSFIIATKTIQYVRINLHKTSKTFHEENSKIAQKDVKLDWIICNGIAGSWKEKQDQEDDTCPQIMHKWQWN